MKDTKKTAAVDSGNGNDVTGQAVVSSCRDPISQNIATPLFFVFLAAACISAIFVL